MAVVKQAGRFKVFYRGKWDEQLFAKCAAVVGSRKMTSYGRQVIKKLVPGLVNQGWTIVSGFMYGVDQTAHLECVDCGGKTIAVLGWGINYPMTNDQIQMSNRIVESGGLIISEWEDQAPTLWSFPARNKIVADLASEIYVIEAAEKSGALITAEMGRKAGKKIWAVPGPVTSTVSAGTNWLIKTGRAQLWTPEGVTGDKECPINHAEIYTILQNDRLTVDDLVRMTGKSASEVGMELTMMMLSGDAAEENGKYYILQEN